MDKSGGQAGKVGHIVEEKLGGFVHLLIVATLSNLDDLGMVWTRDKLLKIGKAVGLGEGKDEFCLNEGLACLLASHLEVANQVLIVA